MSKSIYQEPHKAVRAYEIYFSEFLPGILGKQLIENLKGLDCRVEINVEEDTEPPWQLEVEQGCLARVGRIGPSPECSYHLDIPTLVDVISGCVSPQDAFFQGRIDIQGDIERGLQLSTVLEEFFERFPYVG